MVPFDRAIVVSVGLSIVTIALCLTIWPQFALKKLNMYMNRSFQTYYLLSQS